MAAVTGTKRTVVVPLPDSGIVDEQGILNAIVSLVATTANLLIPDLSWEYISFYSYSAGAFHFNRGLQFDLFCTVAGDANIAANLTAFQTAMGTGIASWSNSISFGW
jgi:hypothetical protein